MPSGKRASVCITDKVHLLLFISDPVKLFCQKVKHLFGMFLKQRGGKLFYPVGEVNDFLPAKNTKVIKWYTPRANQGFFFSRCVSRGK